MLSCETVTDIIIKATAAGATTVQFNSILIYLHENLTAQRPFTK
jgi:hypothetical protein